jgi:hypothetical protein
METWYLKPEFVGAAGSAWAGRAGISDYTPLPADVDRGDGEPARVMESDSLGTGFLEPLPEWLPHRETQGEEERG